MILMIVYAKRKKQMTVIQTNYLYENKNITCNRNVYQKNFWAGIIANKYNKLYLRKANNKSTCNIEYISVIFVITLHQQEDGLISAELLELLSHKKKTLECVTKHEWI